MMTIDRFSSEQVDGYNWAETSQKDDDVRTNLRRAMRRRWRPIYWLGSCWISTP